MPIRGDLRGLIESSTEEIFAAAVAAGMTTCARTESASPSQA